MSRVKSEITFVMNIGNYQSVHITAGFEDDVRQGETEDEAFERVEKKVDERIGKQASAVVEKFAQ